MEKKRERDREGGWGVGGVNESAVDLQFYCYALSLSIMVALPFIKRLEGI